MIEYLEQAHWRMRKLRQCRENTPELEKFLREYYHSRMGIVLDRTVNSDMSIEEGKEIGYITEDMRKELRRAKPKL